MSGRVAVVGAGLGGLAAAIRLAAAGVDVTVLERRDQPGGRAGQMTCGGYRFDTGPSVITMPELVEDLFAVAGESMAEHLALQRLDPAYRAVFADGSVLRVRTGVDAMAGEVAAVCGDAEAARFTRFAGRLRRMYEVEMPAFIDANYDSAFGLLRPVAMARLIRMGGFRRLHALVAAHLRDWRLRRLFTFQAMYAGMSPFEALGVYAVIAYMDVIAGVYFARGGVHRVPQELAALATRCGVELRLSTTVEAIETTGGRVVGVRTSGGERLSCDVVVCNADLPVAYRELLGADHTPRRLGGLRFSPSCVVAHLGLSAKLDGAAHHNIHFSDGYEQSFEDLIAGRMQRDPSWFLTVPTVSDPAMAPAGGEVAFYLLPAPNLHGDALNWDAQGPRELRLAQQRLETAGYGPVTELTVVSEVVTPADWARQGMGAGTPFGVSHHFFQTGPFRPRNVAPRLDGLVFAGSSTTPGVGVPMVLISGKLAAQRALAQLHTPHWSV